MAKSLTLLKQLQATTDKSLKDAQDKLARLTSDGNLIWSDQDQKVLVDVISNAKETLGKLEGDQLKLQSELDDLKGRKIPDQSLYMAAVPTDTDPQIVQWVQEQIRTQVADNILASKHATLEHPDRVEVPPTTQSARRQNRRSPCKQIPKAYASLGQNTAPNLRTRSLQKSERLHRRPSPP